MKDLDMSGVDPLRWAEVRRRVAVIRTYLTIARPNAADRKRHADQLDLGTGQFLTLVRAWREYGRASALSGSGSTKGQTRKTGPRHLAGDVKAAALDVINELDPDITLARAVAAVNKSLEAQGLKPPSRSTIWNMIMQARQNRAGQRPDEAVLVTRCWLQLPTLAGDTLIYPEVVMALRPSTGEIVVASTSIDDDVADRIAASLNQHVPTAEIVVENPLAAPFEPLGFKVTRISTHGANKSLARILGRGFDKVRIVYKPARSADPADILRNVKDRPLDPADANRAIADLIGRHNTSRRAPDCIWV